MFFKKFNFLPRFFRRPQAIKPYRRIKKRSSKNVLGTVGIFGSLSVGVVAVVMILVYLFVITAPVDFPKHSLFSVEKGDTLTDIAERLKEEGYINSQTAFMFSVRRQGSERGIPSGEYYFANPSNVWQAAARFVKGHYGVESVKITIPEGSTKYEIAQILGDKLPKFDRREFMDTAKEGYLFPETYYFQATNTTEAVIERLNDQFITVVSRLSPFIKSSNRDLEDLVTMASIVEEEAYDYEDRRVIADILWKRLDEGMPLQVDVTLRYVTGRGSYDLTVSDLEDSNPYNTYRHSGLPPTPIANPGLDSLKATLNPRSTPYWYFLSDRSGDTHFSETHDEHVEYKRKYIN